MWKEKFTIFLSHTLNESIWKHFPRQQEYIMKSSYISLV